MYHITILTSLTAPMLHPLLASLPVRIHSEATANGFTTLSIECDAGTAARIEAAGFEVCQ
jgi:hypothetical protein